MLGVHAENTDCSGGSLIPMLSLAQNLVDRGCRITYVTARSTAEEMRKLWPVTRPSGGASDLGDRLRLVGIGKAVSHDGRTATDFIWRNVVVLVRCSQLFGPCCQAHGPTSLQSNYFEEALDDLLSAKALWASHSPPVRASARQLIEAFQDTATGTASAWGPPTAAICTTLAVVPTEICLAAGLKTLVELDFVGARA